MEVQTSSDDRIGPTLPRTKCPISALRFRERIDRFPPIFATSFLRQHVRFWEAARHRRTADLGAKRKPEPQSLYFRYGVNLCHAAR
jgi:hypothetical protein